MEEKFNLKAYPTYSTGEYLLRTFVVGGIILASIGISYINSCSSKVKYSCEQNAEKNVNYNPRAIFPVKSEQNPRIAIIENSHDLVSRTNSNDTASYKH